MQRHARRRLDVDPRGQPAVNLAGGSPADRVPATRRLRTAAPELRRTVQPSRRPSAEDAGSGPPSAAAPGSLMDAQSASPMQNLSLHRLHKPKGLTVIAVTQLPVGRQPTSCGAGRPSRVGRDVLAAPYMNPTLSPDHAVRIWPDCRSSWSKTCRCDRVRLSVALATIS